MVKKAEKDIIRQVELKLIDPPDGHVRMEIPERTIFELSESLKEVGLIQAILITPVDGRYEVVVGHRRYLAAKRLNWDKIKAEVKKLDRKEIAIMRATENLQREDLSPIEEAAIYRDLLDDKGFTINMIADKIGKSRTHVEGRMRLLKLDMEIQKAIHARKILIEVGVILSKIKDKKDLYYYLEMAIENGVTPAVARGWTEDVRKSLQYIDSREEPPSPPGEDIIQEKIYTPCQFCEGPMEYKDMRVVKICQTCFDQVRKSLE